MSKLWNVKPDTYRIYPEGSQGQGLFVCLSEANSKVFDYGLGQRQDDGSVKWKGIYSHSRDGWTGLVKRCQELHDLGIYRDKEGEDNEPAS